MPEKSFVIRKDAIPATSENPNASGGKWIYLSPRWYGIIQGILADMENRYLWEGASEDIDNAIQSVLQIESQWSDEIPQTDCPDCGGIEQGKCFEYPATSDIIEYSPTDPLSRGKNRTSTAYPQGAWTHEGKDIPLINVKKGDIYTSPIEFFAGLRDDKIPLIGLPSWLYHVGDEGLPRFKVRVQGSGEIELHLIKIIQGGTAFIVPDGKIDEGKFVDVSTIKADIVTNWQDAIEQLFNVVMNGTLIDTTIYEYTFQDEGSHYIDVTIIPHIDAVEVLSNIYDLIQEGSIEDLGDIAGLLKIGFGGGLRKVVLCGKMAENEQARQAGLSGQGDCLDCDDCDCDDSFDDCDCE